MVGAISCPHATSDFFLLFCNLTVTVKGSLFLADSGFESGECAYARKVIFNLHGIRLIAFLAQRQGNGIISSSVIL